MKSMKRKTKNKKNEKWILVEAVNSQLVIVQKSLSNSHTNAFTFAATCCKYGFSNIHTMKVKFFLSSYPHCKVSFYY